MTQSVVADLFGLSQPTVSRIYRTMLLIFDEFLAVHEPGTLSNPALKQPLLIDGTEVPTRRFKPGTTKNYSGKMKRHGLLIQIAGSDPGCLPCESEPVPGPRHDRWATSEVGREQELDQLQWVADPGYQGTSVNTPQKKPRGGELTDEQKETNCQISLSHSAVERAIEHLKTGIS